LVADFSGLNNVQNWERPDTQHHAIGVGEIFEFIFFHRDRKDSLDDIIIENDSQQQSFLSSKYL
jgi:hypothetical protein